MVIKVKNVMDSESDNTDKLVSGSDDNDFSNAMQSTADTLPTSFASGPSELKNPGPKFLVGELCPLKKRPQEFSHTSEEEEEIQSYIELFIRKEGAYQIKEAERLPKDEKTGKSLIKWIM